jgi:hypothetical protein
MKVLIDGPHMVKMCRTKRYTLNGEMMESGPTVDFLAEEPFSMSGKRLKVSTTSSQKEVGSP